MDFNQIAIGKQKTELKEIRAVTCRIGAYNPDNSSSYVVVWIKRKINDIVYGCSFQYNRSSNLKDNETTRPNHSYSYTASI